jgi:hypothetical protein
MLKDYSIFCKNINILTQMICLQDEVVARDEAIRREYNELDTLWFMAGSLFQVFLDPPSIFSF